MMRKYIFGFLLVFSFLTVSCINNNRKTVDILIVNGTVITMNSNRTILEAGTIAIKDGTIVTIGTSKLLKNKFNAKKIIDAMVR